MSAPSPIPSPSANPPSSSIHSPPPKTQSDANADPPTPSNPPPSPLPPPPAPPPSVPSPLSPPSLLNLDSPPPPLLPSPPPPPLASPPPPPPANSPPPPNPPLEPPPPPPSPPPPPVASPKLPPSRDSPQLTPNSSPPPPPLKSDPPLNLSPPPNVPSPSPRSAPPSSPRSPPSNPPPNTSSPPPPPSQGWSTLLSPPRKSTNPIVPSPSAPSGSLSPLPTRPTPSGGPSLTPASFSPPKDMPPPSGGPPSLPSPPLPSIESSNLGESMLSTNNAPKSHGIGTGGTVAIALVVSFVVVGLVGIVVWFVKKKIKNKKEDSFGYVMPSPSGQSDTSYPMSPSVPLIGNGSGSSGYQYSPSEPKSCFTYEELVQVTNGFSSQNLLGEGGFGPVYKGVLSDGREVAVKQLKAGSGQGEREFAAEVEIISRVHHRHLVSLVGYCIYEDHRLLVYDFVPNNTLYCHLHGKENAVLDWTTRVKIATGAAHGLAYLHDDCHPRIIHRDIKSSNILLDNRFEAQVADFGLAKLTLDANTHVTTRVMGTFGYLAPEYASSGKLTYKSDVFSFGVVLLELITGRKPVDPSQPLEDESLVQWARPLLNRALDDGDVGELPDPRLENNYKESEMFRMIEAAAACVRHSAAMRPRMGQVARALDWMGDSSDLHNGMRAGHSGVLNSARQSSENRLFQRMASDSQDSSTDLELTGGLTGIS